MTADEVVPHVGIRSHAGMVRLGMTRAEVQSLLDRDRDIRVDFRGDPPIVAFIESPKHWGVVRRHRPVRVRGGRSDHGVGRPAEAGSGRVPARPALVLLPGLTHELVAELRVGGGRRTGIRIRQRQRPRPGVLRRKGDGVHPATERFAPGVRSAGPSRGVRFWSHALLAEAAVPGRPMLVGSSHENRSADAGECVEERRVGSRPSVGGEIARGVARRLGSGPIGHNQVVQPVSARVGRESNPHS